ncbi:MAG: TldD/PmbA family protein, partial [Pikeienuella sp.]
MPRSPRMTPLDLAAALVEAARRAGAADADALAVESRDLSVSVRAGALEEAESAESVDYGLRVLIGKRQAFVSASDPAPGVIGELAARAVAMASAAPEDPWCGLPEGGLADPAAAPALEIDDSAPPPAPEVLRAEAERAEAAALGVAGVAQVESAGAGWRRSAIAYAASNGFAGAYARTGASLMVSAIAGEGLGMETDYDAASRTHRADLPPPEEIGARAGRRAAERLNPRRAKTGAFPGLFHRRAAGSLVGHVRGALTGAAGARGASWLKDRMGERVRPAGFDLTDDPFRLRGLGSRPFDGEGMALAERRLIEDGVLKGWVLDCAAARRLGLAAPGGARRGPG